MAKIAFVSQPRDPVAATDAQSGSVTIVLWELATRLAQRHDVTILAPEAPGQPPEETSQSGIRIKRLPVLRSLHKALDLATGTLELGTPYFATSAFFREYALGVASWLRRARPDIVHLQISSQFLPVFRAAVPTAQIFLHVHDEFLSLLPDKVIRPRLQHVTAVVTCSDYVTRRLQSRLAYLSTRIHTVGNGVNTSYFQPRERAADSGRIGILFVGRVSPEKGIHTLAEAFAAVAADDQRVELEVVGSAGLLPFNQIKLLSADPYVAALRPFYGTGFWSSMEKQVLHAHTSYWRAIEAHIPADIRNRVHLHGPLSRDRLRQVYDRAAVLVMPSHCMEPFGLPVVEAMASGLPCITSRAGGMPDIVADNITGLLVERGDVPGLAAAIRRLALDGAERANMGRAGRKRVTELFDWSVATTRLESLYYQYVKDSAHAAERITGHAGNV